MLVTGSLPPATKLRQGYVFIGICDSVHRGGCAWPGGGGHAWLGVCVAGGVWQGGMHGRDCASQGVCGRGACMAERVYAAGMHGRGCMWQGVCIGTGMHGRGHVWQEACMAGGMCGRGHAWQGVCMKGQCVWWVAGEMAIAVGSIHPTGMHSC